jgi:asparagine synthase (glutamine-hydrolysing)
MMAQDMRTYLPDDILCKVDRAAMGVSLETRVPFLDKEVISLSMRIPTHMKIRRSTGKWILRQVLQKYVPHELIDRPKAGFAIPVGHWIRTSLKDWAEELLSEQALEKHGKLNTEVVRKIWKQHISGKYDHTTKLWSLLMFQAWFKRWS